MMNSSLIWTLPSKKVLNVLRSISNSGALVLGSVLVFALGPQDATAQTQTIILNTGWSGQTSAGSVLPVFQSDDDWRIVADPVIANPLPRPAIVVSNITTTHIKWPAALAKSGWISGSGDKYYNFHLPTPPTHFTYRACFNLPPQFSAPTLAMQLRADDIVRHVGLNTTALYNESAGMNQIVHASATKAGSFLGPPLSINPPLAAGFQVGQNCIDVGVDDEQQIVSGLNAVATVTYCNGGNQDLSTGVASWQVNAAPAYKTAAFPSWATTDPSGGALPAGTQWIQPANSPNPVNEPGGPYTYILKFTLPCAGTTTVRGWFAADNAATLQIDSGPTFQCTGNSTNQCFQHPTNFTAQTISGIGPHTITVKVTNAGGTATQSPTGLLAHITIP